MTPAEIHTIREAASYFESRGSDAFAEKLNDIIKKYGKIEQVIEQELYCKKFRTKINPN